MLLSGQIPRHQEMLFKEVIEATTSRIGVRATYPVTPLPLINSDLSTLPPDYTPVGGRLQQFHPIWQSVTTEKWVIGIIQNGYCLELTSNPPNIPPRTHKLSPEHLQLLEQEVQSLLLKGAIEPVTIQYQGSGVYSLYFLIPKKDCSLRPILDLRELNHYILSEHFHMVTLQQVLPLLQKADFMSTLDLKDASFHVPIHLAHRKYFRYVIAGEHYQFKVLPFGVTTAPRVFTNCLA